MQQIDTIVAGAGIWGCTVARRLAEAGRKVLVLEQRPVPGGNVRCAVDPETGIEIHSYGSHIFHTHLPEVWAFVNRFVSFNGYQHKVLACYKGRMYHLPLGLTLVNKFFGVELKPGETAAFLDGASGAGRTRRDDLFDAFFRGYTSKQWGRAPEDIDPSIIRRVPVRTNYDTNYFNDYDQGIPRAGYNALFERLLDHPNVTLACGASLTLAPGGGLRVREASGETDLPPVPVYYSGPLDRLFDYRFGHLPWRTLRFETETLDVPDFQGTSVVNYTEAEIPYTRIHEFAHYHPESGGVLGAAPGAPARTKTVIMREYPAAWKPGDEPYYPIDNPDSQALLERYRAAAAAVPHLHVGGRLGAYRYFDMDKSIAAAMALDLENPEPGAGSAAR